MRRASVMVTIARQLELAARVEVVAAVRRLREAGETWRTIASLLAFDDLPAAVADPPPGLAFDYVTGLPRGPWFDQPRFAWDCPVCADCSRPRAERVPGVQPALAREHVVQRVPGRGTFVIYSGSTGTRCAD